MIARRRPVRFLGSRHWCSDRNAAPEARTAWERSPGRFRVCDAAGIAHVKTGNPEGGIGGAESDSVLRTTNYVRRRLRNVTWVLGPTFPTYGERAAMLVFPSTPPFDYCVSDKTYTQQLPDQPFGLPPRQCHAP